MRESLFTLYSEEIPYSCEVVIDSFRDKTSDLSVIEAAIVVSRESQKLIVVGKGGLKLKELGIQAREKLQKVRRLTIDDYLFIRRLIVSGQESLPLSEGKSG